MFWLEISIRIIRKKEVVVFRSFVMLANKKGALSTKNKVAKNLKIRIND